MSEQTETVFTSVLSVETSVCLAVENAELIRAQWPKLGWPMRPISLEVTYLWDTGTPTWRTSSWQVNGVRILTSGAPSRAGTVSITSRELLEPPAWVFQAIDDHRPKVSG
jgi:hypothetical protein